MQTTIEDDVEVAYVPVATNNPNTALLSVIERVALDPKADIEKLERMLAMQERILDRDARMAFASALSQMQADLPSIDQNGRIEHNGKLISTYATFEDINDVVKPVLQRHGFAVSFRIKQAEAKIEVTAILSHRDGHSEETSMALPADTSGAKNAVQAQGSSVSYGKRYTLCALLNITTRGEDDDGRGEKAVLPHERAVEIDLMIGEVSADKAKFLQFMGVGDVRQILAKDYAKAKNALQAKKKGAKQ